MICHRWLIVLAVALASPSSRGLIHPKSMSNLYSSSDNNRSNNDDGAANSQSLTSDAEAEALALQSETADNAIQQPDQRWIKPSPKGLNLSFKYM